MRAVLSILVGLAATALLLAVAAELVRERASVQDITDPVPVSLVSVPDDEPPPPEEERKPPEPPEKEPQVDFAPELPTPSLTAPQLAGPAVAIDPSLVGGPAPTGSLAFDVSDLDRPPRSVVRRQPQYPYRARQRRIEGRVRVRFLVGVDGRTSRIEVVEAEPEGVFEQAVIDAVSGWRFEPGVLAGERVAAWVVTPIVFDLSGGN
ncbi:TonB family protein [bacterium]|nr:TonB family protein [bacterium]